MPSPAADLGVFVLTPECNLAIRIPRIRTNTYAIGPDSAGQKQSGGNKQQQFFACHEISLHLEVLAPQGFRASSRRLGVPGGSGDATNIEPRPYVLFNSGQINAGPVAPQVNLILDWLSRRQVRRVQLPPHQPGGGRCGWAEGPLRGSYIARRDS